MTEPLSNFSVQVGLHPVDDASLPAVQLRPYLCETALQLAPIISRLGLYQMYDDLVFFDHKGTRQLMTPHKFRNWINHQGVITCRKYDRDSPRPIPETMHKQEAETLLCDEAFLRGVRILKGTNHVRCPVIRPDGALDALPWGYDEQTQIYTVPGGVEFDMTLPLEVAKGRFHRLLKDFPLTDERSLAVQVAAMLALFIRHLPGGSALRPGFLWYANKPGAGKSVLAKVCLYVVMGAARVAKLKKADELDKEIEAFCRAAVPYIFLDNIRGGLNSTTIEQMLTSEESTGRAMGGHDTFDAKNTALLLATGNQIELTDDAMRRFLIVDLFEKGDTVDRKIETPLEGFLMASDQWRCEMLEALWAMVRNWHEKEMPSGSQILPTFETYSRLLGGIVEAAGYESPFQPYSPPEGQKVAKSDFTLLMDGIREDMEVEGRKSKDYLQREIVKIARSKGLFHGNIGTAEDAIADRRKREKIPAEWQLEDDGYLRDAVSGAFTRVINRPIGTEIKDSRGRRIEFGKRTQSNKATWTMRLIE